MVRYVRVGDVERRVSGRTPPRSVGTSLITNLTLGCSSKKGKRQVGII